MSKKKTTKTDKKQSDRFKKLASELEAAGELNLTEGKKVLDRIVRKGVRKDRAKTD